MLEMVQDSDTVTVEDQQEIICGISNGINSNDLEWPWMSFTYLLQVFKWDFSYSCAAVDNTDCFLSHGYDF